jgi:hypothetical protein
LLILPFIAFFRMFDRPENCRLYFLFDNLEFRIVPCLKILLSTAVGGYITRKMRMLIRHTASHSMIFRHRYRRAGLIVLEFETELPKQYSRKGASYCYNCTKVPFMHHHPDKGVSLYNFFLSPCLEFRIKHLLICINTSSWSWERQQRPRQGSLCRASQRQHRRRSHVLVCWPRSWRQPAPRACPWQWVHRPSRGDLLADPSP